MLGASDADDVSGMKTQQFYLLCAHKLMLGASGAGDGSGHSTSVMFIIYMVIGFTATLSCIMVLTLLYFTIR